MRTPLGQVYGTVFRVAAGSHGGTTLNSRPSTNAALSALALFLIKTTAGGGKEEGGRGRGREDVEKKEMVEEEKREGAREESAEIKKFTGAPRHSMAS